jgi:ribosomal protein RSM22 (predicted rRNA methylase)
MAIVHLAMFDAVNSIETHLSANYAQLPATRETSKEAAATTAAGTVLDCGRGSGRVALAKDMGTLTVHF